MRSGTCSFSAFRIQARLPMTLQLDGLKSMYARERTQLRNISKCCERRRRALVAAMPGYDAVTVMNRATIIVFALAMTAAFAAPQSDVASHPLRLAIAGLVHGHVDGFLRAMRNRADVQLVGVADADPELQQRYAGRYKLDSALFF